MSIGTDFCSAPLSYIQINTPQILEPTASAAHQSPVTSEQEQVKYQNTANCTTDSIHFHNHNHRFTMASNEQTPNTEPSLIGGHAEYVKGAAEVSTLP